MAIYTRNNLSDGAVALMVGLYKVLAFVAEQSVFVYLGMALPLLPIAGMVRLHPPPPRPGGEAATTSQAETPPTPPRTSPSSRSRRSSPRTTAASTSRFQQRPSLATSAP